MKVWNRLSDKIKNILLINKFKAIILKFTEVFAIHDTDGIKLRFRHNFNDAINTMCKFGLGLVTKILLHLLRNL